VPFEAREGTKERSKGKGAASPVAEERISREASGILELKDKVEMVLGRLTTMMAAMVEIGKDVDCLGGTCMVSRGSFGIEGD